MTLGHEHLMENFKWTCLISPFGSLLSLLFLYLCNTVDVRNASNLLRIVEIYCETLEKKQEILHKQPGYLVPSTLGFTQHTPNLQAMMNRSFLFSEVTPPQVAHRWQKSLCTPNNHCKGSERIRIPPKARSCFKFQGSMRKMVKFFPKLSGITILRISLHLLLTSELPSDCRRQSYEHQII